MKIKRGGRFHAAAWMSLSSVVLAACGSSVAGQAGSNGTSANSGSTKGYSVGVIADLTGPAASLGVPQANGVKFWADEVDGTGGIGGHPVKLVTCDSTGTAQGGVSCASKMAGVPIVINLALIGEVNASLPSLTGSIVLATTPLLFPSKSKNPNAYQTEPTIGQSDGLALAAAQKNGIHTVGVIATDDATGTGAVKAMQAEAAHFNVNLVVQYVTESVTSATVQMTKLLSAHAGMVFVAAPGGPAAVVAQAYKSLGMTQPLVVTTADVTDPFLKSIASVNLEALYGVPAVAILPAALEEPYRTKTAALIKKYQTKAGKPLDYPTALGYYTGQAAGDIIAATGYGASLATMEKYINTHKLPTDLGSLDFTDPASNIETGLNPAFVQMASSKTSWEPCKSTSSFQC